MHYTHTHTHTHTHKHTLAESACFLSKSMRIFLSTNTARLALVCHVCMCVACMCMCVCRVCVSPTTHLRHNRFSETPRARWGSCHRRRRRRLLLPPCLQHHQPYRQNRGEAVVKGEKRRACMIICDLEFDTESFFRCVCNRILRCVFNLQCILTVKTRRHKLLPSRASPFSWESGCVGGHPII